MLTGTHRARLALAALLALAAGMSGCSSKDEDGDKEKPPGYLKSMVIAKDLAEERICQVNLRDISSSLRVYAATEEIFPPGSGRGWGVIM